MPFEPRDLPTVIWVGEEPIVGPFCAHCGYPLTMHRGGDLACLKLPNPALPPPSCGCHTIKLVTAEVMEQDPAYVGRKRRRRRTIERHEIVRAA